MQTAPNCPVFLTRWPKDDSFEALDQEFHDQHSDSEASDDDINLMIVWLSNRLPYEMVDMPDVGGTGEQQQEEQNQQQEEQDQENPSRPFK